VTVLSRSLTGSRSTFAARSSRVTSRGMERFMFFANMEPVTLTRPMSQGGVPYEATVYSKVLAPLHTSTPAFYGVYREKRPRQTWL